jgi:[acyl-carrier-protein] S-malonyltransferase
MVAFGTPVLLQASADDKFADYKPTTAFFFPGQGAQSVGMAKVRLTG